MLHSKLEQKENDAAQALLTAAGEQAVLEEIEKPEKTPGVIPKNNYIEFLLYLENTNQIKSIKKLRTKVIRQRKELELWQKGKEVEILKQQQEK